MYHGHRFFFHTQTLIHGSSSMGLSSWCWLLPWADTSALLSSTERNTGLCGCTGECRPMGLDADATEWILPLTITSRDWLPSEVIYRTKQAQRLSDNWKTMKSASYKSTEKLLLCVRNVEKKRSHLYIKDFDWLTCYWKNETQKSKESSIFPSLRNMCFNYKER